MGAFEEAKEYLVEALGMWWPDADEGKLREAADAWRTFADEVHGVRGATNSKAQDIITQNKGDSVEAFDEFWRRYHHGNKGWLKDLEDASRSMAKALDDFADDISGAKSQIDTQLEITAAVIVAGIGLSLLTAGLASGASAAAATTIVDMAATLGVSVSTGVARLAATTMVGVAFGGVESVTVDLAVAQPLKNAAGLQNGYSIDHAREAGTYGALVGGAFGAGAGTYKNIKDAGGFKNSFQGIRLNLSGPSLATPNGVIPVGPTGQRLMNPNGSGRLDSHWLFAWKDLPQEVRDNFFRGNKFNNENYARYPANEVHLSNGKRLDSYVPGKEIVSRKHTQMAGVDPKTARSYLDEIINKYEPDTIIRSNKYPDLDGKPLQGDMILEVPVQHRPIPDEIIEHAQELDIVIRDVAGRVYT
ncbi:WXG100 family type VII secretion target [Streptomyces sp. 8N706]|uniref:WXG100 family type VII secretion target n=1 Tax=Streptomyces sp. 8N706 TaxID=3457416 RepID=UPI003FD1245C